MAMITLTPGTILSQGPETFEVLSIEGDKMQIKMLEGSPHMESYLHYNKPYTVELHPGTVTYQVWEVLPEEMDRDSSQVLIYLWPEGDVGIEIDF